MFGRQSGLLREFNKRRQKRIEKIVSSSTHLLIATAYCNSTANRDVHHLDFGVRTTLSPGPGDDLTAPSTPWHHGLVATIQTKSQRTR